MPIDRSPEVEEDPDVSKSWDVVIEPRGRFASLDLRSVWRYRDLAWMFFKRDFVALYKQTVLGPLWYLIQPTLMALIYYVVFGRIAKISTDGLPPFVFYLSGIVIWSYFSTCLVNNSELFAKNAPLFSKVYFPRLVVPISVVLSGTLAFAVQFLLLLIVAVGFIFTATSFTLNWSALPAVSLLVLYVAGLGMGVGLIVSALTVRYRDLAFATGFFTQLWMFGSPVVYPFSQIPDSYTWLFFLNPMTAPIETLRQLLFGSEGIGMAVWFSNVAIMVVLLITGGVLFSRAETNAMDTV